MDEAELNEKVDTLFREWQESNTYFAYQVAQLYASGDYDVIQVVMERFKVRVRSYYTKTYGG